MRASRSSVTLVFIFIYFAVVVVVVVVVLFFTLNKCQLLFPKSSEDSVGGHKNARAIRRYSLKNTHTLQGKGRRQEEVHLQSLQYVYVPKNK